MPCGKGTMRWKRAMRVARKDFPRLSLKRRRRIAAKLTRAKIIRL